MGDLSASLLPSYPGIPGLHGPDTTCCLHMIPQCIATSSVILYPRVRHANQLKKDWTAAKLNSLGYRSVVHERGKRCVSATNKSRATILISNYPLSRPNAIELATLSHGLSYQGLSGLLMKITCNLNLICGRFLRSYLVCAPSSHYGT